MKTFRRAIFIFHRDLRLADNKALHAALRSADVVSCVFVVDPRFNIHPDKKQFAKHFLYSSLKLLDEELHEYGAALTILSGSYVDILRDYIDENSIDSIFVNHEYTPIGRQRELQLTALAGRLAISCFHFHDALLFAPGEVLKADGKPYSVFTPFYNKAKQLVVELVGNLPAKPVFITFKDKNSISFNELAEYWHVDAKYSDIRKMRMEVLQALADCQFYQAQRDFPAQQATSGLSVHLKFGTISVRQAYWAVVHYLGSSSALLRQFYWRDFFSHIGFFFPSVFHSAFHSQFALIKWRNDRDDFERWCSGTTGFPMVDAGMRELLATGRMHNRLRMIVASFLVKDLHIDWRWGERFFADHLVDYDAAVNNGNWQWAASTGCDAQPYFRIFNPWLQQKKFDGQCRYIYQWIPELRAYTPAQIHAWYKHNAYEDYPAPICDHSLRAQEAKLLFKLAAESYDLLQTEQ